MGQSQQILYATMVAVLNSHPTLPSVTAISDRAIHLQSRQRARLTRKGQGWSKMACRVPRSKGSSGSLMFERESGYPSYENISLSNWLQSISIIMIETLFSRGFSLTLISICSSLQSPLEDWDTIQKRLVFCSFRGCSDSKLELLWMAQSGMILLRSCS